MLLLPAKRVWVGSNLHYNLCNSINNNVQERVACDHEVKMVYLNGIFNHFVVDGGNTRRIKQSLSGFRKAELIEFGKVVMESLACSDESCILEGLFRVDIFKGNNGSLVVNELETMDMSWFSSNTQAYDRVILFLEEFWETKIYHCISKLAEAV